MQHRPLSAPDIDRSASLGRTRGQQGPPAEGGSILVPPSADTYVLRFPSAPSPALLTSLETGYGLVLQTLEGADSDFLGLFQGPENLDLQEVLQSAGDEVTDASPNERVLLAEDASLTGGFVVGEWDPDEMATGSGLESLGLPTAHAVGVGSGVRIAILDTGADLTHPFLASHIQPLPSGSTLVSYELLDGVDDDDDGEIDEAYGHGTHVAGIILQVAPEATLVPIRVLNADGVGSLWDLLSGLNLAVQQDVQVVNLSIAMTSSNETMEGLLGKFESQYIKVVAAAGNAGLESPTYPGTSSRTMGVAAVDGEGVLAPFSGGGPHIVLAAPGVSILSAFPDNRMARASGTSMATAAASGAIAILRDGIGMGSLQGALRLAETAASITPSGAVEAGTVSPIDALGISRD
ncbi:MAG: S8 family serine peptidase [Candidatus Eisenbacteria bacterium]